MTTSAEMTSSLKALCVPVLRTMGFKGSFPNFYRDTDGFVALVHFQFNRAGDGFCINLGYADAERRNVVSHRRHVAAKDLRVSFTGGLGGGSGAVSERWRVGSRPLGDGLYSDSWFSFAPGAGDAKALAQSCAALIEDEAEAWWSEKRAYAASL